MALSEDEQREFRAATTVMAHALLDDLEHIQEVILRPRPTQGDMRRLSVQLRRILVEGELRQVASPRIGKVEFLAPDTKPYQKIAWQLFSAGDVELLGIGMGHLKMAYDHPSNWKIGVDAGDVFLNQESFMRQKIVCYDGNWVTRTNLIKYVAIVLGGAHTKDASTDEAYALIDKVSRRFLYEVVKENGEDVGRLTIIQDGGPPYHPDFDKMRRRAVSIPHMQMIATAQYLLKSPDVIRLTKYILAELS